MLVRKCHLNEECPPQALQLPAMLANVTAPSGGAGSLGEVCSGGGLGGFIAWLHSLSSAPCVRMECHQSAS